MARAKPERKKRKSFWVRNPGTPEEIRQYCIHLKTGKKVARQTSTQAICAIKIFWEKTLKRRWPEEVELARANPEFKLPVILSAGEVRRVLEKVTALDHRVCLITIYSCGLRLGEGLRLQVRDIDSERMLLSGILNPKGIPPQSPGLTRMRLPWVDA